MRHLIHLAEPKQQADTLLVLLPGAYYQPEDFIKQGFVSAVQERQSPVDLMMAELSFDQITNQTALTEIHNALIQPAIAKGYQKIWLAGISIGGYVAIAYASRYPAQLAGLLLLAPYPGNRITTGEITMAGGIQAWMPKSIADDDIELGNWNWLKNKTNTTDIEVHLGFGEDDRFADGHQMIAQTLPASRVNKISGGHAWPVWQRLWHNFLDKRFAKEPQVKVAYE